MKFVTLNGTTLHYQWDGDPHGTPLVLIHSLGTDLRIWDDLIPHLDPAPRVLRFDLRGHGLSADPADELPLSVFSSDVVALLDHFGIAQATILGLSIGGLIALDFALRYPARVNALLLSDTAAKIGTAELWQTRMDTLRTHGMAHLVDAILPRWFAPDFATRHPAPYEGAHTLFVRNSVLGYTAACAALRDGDLRADVSQITVPALILCGSEDAATPPSVVQTLADALPNARFALIPDAGHTPPIEQPMRMAEAINDFLSKINVLSFRTK
ncbi:MAG TPA: 3-oxoadipate enol-lactonase [Anaerolineales bacterium]|nr:3-oxoadipate enol-lactonase [Anaerolineales bacterium]